MMNYNTWALKDGFDLFTAAALWCEKEPYRCGSWEDTDFSEVGNCALNILEHQFIAENYPPEKMIGIRKILGEKLALGREEFLQSTGKFILSRVQLKAIALRCGVEPEFLFCSAATFKVIPEKSSSNDSSLNLRGQNRDIDKWLFEMWSENNNPGGSEFFTILKRYKNERGSPIIDHYSSGKKPGIKWRTANLEGELSKKRIQNKVGEWKNDVNP
ncbi:MAG: hypothetical protein PSN04_10975 [Methyloprofundus sp.]|nr:hypothetical protein [Methyloprofundus sp.]